MTHLTLYELAVSHPDGRRFACGHLIAELAEAYARIDALERDVASLEAGELRDTELDELRFQINERLTWHFDPPDCATLDTNRVRVDAGEWLPVVLEGELDTDACCIAWRARLNSIDGGKALYDIAQEG